MAILVVGLLDIRPRAGRSEAVMIRTALLDDFARTGREFYVVLSDEVTPSEGIA